MIVELGHFALVLALLVAVFQMVVPAYGAHVRDERLMGVADPAALCQLGLLLVSFLALMQAYVTSDFSVANVASNSHSTKPLLYRISGVWGNHEGSMVLWVLILALFGAAVAAFGRNLPPTLKANVLAVQASIAVAFTLFILLTSNPFLRVEPPPADGSGLNPILQDPALAFHPPFLYTGYVGFSVAYSFALAALIEGRIDAAWARWVRPWTLAAWMCLTLGIAMGSWWAYYELGWGGWWFWDPVENASFMPWLAGTALLHSALVMEKRDALKVWTVLLAILTFSLSLMGTFLVRSGVLTSVHAFAVDPQRGVFILSIMALFTGGGLALFALRARDLRQGGIFAPLSREGALVLNNILLTTACATVFVGTLYPLLLEALTGDKISVGPPYFDWTFGPLMVPLLLALPFGPFLAWKRGDVLGAAQRLMFAAMLAVVVMALALAAMQRGPWLAPFGLALGVFVMAGSVSDLTWRVRLGEVPLGEAWRRLLGLPRSAIGTALAHFGVGMLVVGVVATSAYREEKILIMQPGQQVAVAGYDLAFRGVAPATGANYREEVAVFDVTRAGAAVARLEPSRRIYDMPPEPTTEAGIHAGWRGDLYVVLGDRQSAGGYAVRVYFNPLVRFIWLGAVVMFLAGAVSLSDRRLRVGAPGRARRALAAPAE
ncbi:MAG: heme lyase CcmF/NrfE family subunit [Hyphomicrobium sp.]|uniref:heme lyase CcmF/NrfE family subunit n=1 Tax=Hyphomicrobium sp. TaxID=82 RepID=UPI0013248E8B|nr:heme lyase CcmF/NrfE family subunit [Hyphomicrobium sp.]KAB2937489.1 MAG: heme lyase CcmF/NrfE family subunit [Hyphomicrobium sp.]MBZ0211793.1 heme lyase CcmF/NrfE family subunit [Hyphomicrobium sp.]